MNITDERRRIATGYVDERITAYRELGDETMMLLYDDILAMLNELDDLRDKLPWKVSEGDGETVAGFASRSYAEAFCNELLDWHPTWKPLVITGPDDNLSHEEKTGIPAPDYDPEDVAFSDKAVASFLGLDHAANTEQPTKESEIITFKPWEPPFQSVEGAEDGKIVAGLHIDYALCDEQQPVDMVNRGGVAYVKSGSDKYDAPIGPSHSYRVIPPDPETLADLPDLCLAVGTDGKLYSKWGDRAWIRKAENLLEYHQAPTNPAAITITHVLGYPGVKL